MTIIHHCHRQWLPLRTISLLSPIFNYHFSISITIASTSNFQFRILYSQFVAVCGSLLALVTGTLLKINGDCRAIDCQLQSTATSFQISGAVILWFLAAFASVSMCACCIGCLSDEEEANLERAAQGAFLNQHDVPMSNNQKPEGAVAVPMSRY